MENKRDAGKLKYDMFQNCLEYVLGNAECLFNIQKQCPYEIFAEQTVELLDSLSVALRSQKSVEARFDLPGGTTADVSMAERKTTRARNFPDVAAFGFWCRRASVLEMKKRYLGACVGRGVSLHFVSSNIPVLFGFSMAAALLAGDCVLMRLPSKRTPQEDIIVDALRSVLEKFPIWKERIVLFRSPHDREITDALSALCDVRVIWGGDRAVREIRQSPLPVRALELPFADRRSAAVFSAAAVLETEDLPALVRGFYNDTYRNDQNACSSPHLLFWLGDDVTVRRAKERFWGAVEQNIEIWSSEETVPTREGSDSENLPGEASAQAELKSRGKDSFEACKCVGRKGLDYRMQPAVAVKKWEQALYLAAKSSVRISRRGNLAIIVEPETLTPQIWEENVPGGFFFQSSGTDFEPLLPALSRKVQTLSCFGVNRRELAARLVAAGVTGVDRIVEVGHALDFSLVWDGMDLIGQMSREIWV